MTYHQQLLYLSDGSGSPAEIINAARLSANLNRASLCGSTFDNVLANGGCDGLLYEPSIPSVISEALFHIDAIDGSAAQQRVPNRGRGGSLLDATLGATGAASTDDPKWFGGAEPYLYLPGVVANNSSTLNAAPLQITGDIDIMVRVAMDDWTPAALSALVSKYVATTSGYALQVDTAGTLSLVVRLAASDITVSSTVATGFVDGSSHWLRVTRVSSTGVVTFYTAPDIPDIPTNWTILGTAVTGTSGAITSGTALLYVGVRNGASNATAGKFFRFLIRNNIGDSTSTVIDADYTTRTAIGSFTASTGQTIGINRTNGADLPAIEYFGRPSWGFGTNDFMLVPETDLLDFSATAEFSVMVISRQYGPGTGPLAQQTLISKQNTTTTAGWRLDSLTSGATRAAIHDGATAINNDTAVVTWDSSVRTWGMVRETSPTKQVTDYSNGVATGAVADTTTATLANAIAMRIGSLGNGSQFFVGEIFAVLVWDRALTSAEMLAVNTYYRNAISPTGSCWSAADFSAAAAPWYDGSTAASEALGFWIEEWTGLDGAHHTRSSTPTGQNRGGSRFGAQSNNQRVMKLNVLLHGTTERGLEYLFRWLEQTLVDACDPCGDRSAWWREFCPSNPVTNPEEGYVRAEKIALIEGPTWESAPARDSGCYLRRVSFALAAGDPCLYREPGLLTSNVSTTVGATGSTAQVSTCGTFYSSSMRTMARLVNPSYGRAAPVVLITSPFEGLVGVPALRIAGYSDSFGTFDPCRSQLLGELILEGANTSGLDIEVDMAERRVRTRNRYAGTDWEDGSRLIGPALSTGVRRWWSADGCTNAFVVVEPVYVGLASNRYVSDAVVSQWTVNIYNGVRFGCS